MYRLTCMILFGNIGPLMLFINCIYMVGILFKFKLNRCICNVQNFLNSRWRNVKFKKNIFETQKGGSNFCGKFNLTPQPNKLSVTVNSELNGARWYLYYQKPINSCHDNVWLKANINRGCFFRTLKSTLKTVKPSNLLAKIVNLKDFEEMRS